MKKVAKSNSRVGTTLDIADKNREKNLKTSNVRFELLLTIAKCALVIMGHKII